MDLFFFYFYAMLHIPFLQTQTAVVTTKCVDWNWIFWGNGLCFFPILFLPFKNISQCRESERKRESKGHLGKLRLAHCLLLLLCVLFIWMLISFGRMIGLKCTLMLFFFLHLFFDVIVVLIIWLLLQWWQWWWCFARDWKRMGDQKTHFHSFSFFSFSICCCCLPNKIFPLTSNAKRMWY